MLLLYGELDVTVLFQWYFMDAACAAAGADYNYISIPPTDMSWEQERWVCRQMSAIRSWIPMNNY